MMVFIKGAWIDMMPEDDRYLEYYCCPARRLMIVAPDDPKEPIYYACGMRNTRKICNRVYDRNHREPITPDWCPLREEKRGKR